MNKADGYRFDGVTDQRSQEQTPDLSGGCAHQYRHQGREGFRDFRAASTITGTNGGCAQRLCHLPARSSPPRRVQPCRRATHANQKRVWFGRLRAYSKNRPRRNQASAAIAVSPSNSSSRS